MSDDKPERSGRSLLRRMLQRATEEVPVVNVDQPPKPASATLSPSETPRPSASPVRPTMTPPSQPSVPLMPQVKPPEQPEIPLPSISAGQMATVEQLLRAEESLEAIRTKMGSLAQEFADGKLNRAQFAAMYARYNEMRRIIEQMLTINPTSNAWERVANSGHTIFLKKHFAAQVLAFAIVLYTATPGAGSSGQTVLKEFGEPPVPLDLARQMVAAVQLLSKGNEALTMVVKQIEGGHWLVAAPGKYAVTFVLYSLEPASRQAHGVQDLHVNFERANRMMLERGWHAENQIVYPHRSLFKKEPEF